MVFQLLNWPYTPCWNSIAWCSLSLPGGNSFQDLPVCINTCAGGWIRLLPLQRSRFSIHHFNSILEFLFKVARSKLERFAFKDDICCICRYRQFILAGNTAWIVDVNNPISFVSSKINNVFWSINLWHSDFTFWNFSWVKEISLVVEFMLNLFLRWC